MPGLNIDLSLSFSNFQLFSAVINPEMSGSQVICSVPKRIFYYLYFLRKFLSDVIDKPYQFIFLIATLILFDQFFCNILRITCISCCSFYTAEYYFILLNRKYSAQIKRYTLKSGFPQSLLNVSLFLIHHDLPFTINPFFARTTQSYT